MAVYIYDKDVLNRMAMVEGSEWLTKQQAMTPDTSGYPQSFAAWKAAWDELAKARYEAETDEDKAALEEMGPDFLIEGGDGAIYGRGGWHRYLVTSGGEIIFSRHHSTHMGERLAEEARITVR